MSKAFDCICHRILIAGLTSRLSRLHQKGSASRDFFSIYASLARPCPPKKERQNKLAQAPMFSNPPLAGNWTFMASTSRIISIQDLSSMVKGICNAEQVSAARHMTYQRHSTGYFCGRKFQSESQCQVPTLDRHLMRNIFYLFSTRHSIIFHFLPFDTIQLWVMIIQNISYTY